MEYSPPNRLYTGLGSAARKFPFGIKEKVALGMRVDGLHQMVVRLEFTRMREVATPSRSFNRRRDWAALPE